MRKGTTKSGFAYEFDETRLDDMRFVDVMAVIVSEDAADFDQIVAVSTLMTMLLGAEQKKRLYDHIGSQYDGRVPLSVFKDCLEEIMSNPKKENESKN